MNWLVYNFELKGSTWWDLLLKCPNMVISPPLLILNGFLSDLIVKICRKCTGRLRIFLWLYLHSWDSMVECSKVLCDRAKKDDNNSSGSEYYTGNASSKRAERNEITNGTDNNYFQIIKLFCEMSDISLPRKRLSRGIPKSRKLQMIERQQSKKLVKC